MHGQEKYASVPTRILGFARITASLDDEIRFTTVAPLTPPIAGLKNAKLPNSLIQFLLGLDKKLDMLLAHQYVEQLKNEYPLQLDIRKISGDTISFASIPEIPDNTALEVVMMLRQMPLQLAAAKGTAQKIQKGKRAHKNYKA